MGYKLLTNSELQVLIKSRNQQAFKELYNRYWDKVFAICNNRLGNSAIAQDLVQDIFISLWNNDQLDAIQNLEAYLYQSCKYAVIKEFHKSNRYDNVSSTALGDIDQEMNFDLNAEIEAKILENLLQHQIEKLPEKTKIIFNYSRIDNLNSKEIAEKLHISHRTVENQISLALKELRKFLKKVNSIIIF